MTSFGDAVERRDGRTGERVSEETWALVSECLPISMAALSDAGVRIVLPRLRGLVDAGWRPREIREVLTGVGLPDNARSMPHLVAHHLGAITPGSAPGRVGEARRRAEQAAQQASLGLTDDAVTTASAENEAEVRAQGVAYVRSLAAKNPREAEEWARRVCVPWPLEVMEGEA
ncbi:MAG TPA: hypothetical protein VFC82_07735 [Actinomycetaceae bacterium]|nr:hypothetical protein [Actinomycetaceae bacterium]